MAEDSLDHLKSLHTNAIDARHGYEEALRDAEGRGMTPLFREMIALHTSNATALATALHTAGEAADDGGSFMSTIHRTIMSVRSLFGGLDASVLPGLIDGEERNVSHYDAALQAPDMSEATRALLTRQRDRLQAAIATMRALKHVSGETISGG